jgi:HEAT repeat protein
MQPSDMIINQKDCRGLFEQLITSQPYALIDKIKLGELSNARMGEALEIIGQLNYELIHDIYANLVNHHNSLVRGGIVCGLALHSENVQARQLLKQMADSDPSETIRYAAGQIYFEHRSVK